MNIKIITIGNIKDLNLLELIKKYFKRIEKYCKIELLELKESNLKSVNENIKIETNKIIEKLNIFPDYEKYLLDLKGKLVSSKDFASIIENNKNYNKAKIIFIIGASNGVDKIINNYINFKISFGNITFPHQLFRLILLEQIYRSFKIIRNEKYHK